MHWGSNVSVGSEHSLNGLTYPMEMHFVHYSCNFSDISTPIDDFDMYEDELDLNLAVIGIIFELSDDGEDNEYLAKILDNIGDIKHTGENKTITNLNVVDMLSVYQNNSDLWYYHGGLTTPPCYPIVRWHVLKQKLKINESQLDLFRKLRDYDNRSLIENWRPITGDGSGPNHNLVYEFNFSRAFVTTTESTETTETTTDSAFNKNHRLFGYISLVILVVCSFFTVYHE